MNPIINCFINYFRNQRNKKNPDATVRVQYNCSDTIFCEEVRQKQIFFFCLFYDEMLIHDDHSLWPFCCGNHACFCVFFVKVEMFFSSFLLIIPSKNGVQIYSFFQVFKLFFRKKIKFFLSPSKVPYFCTAQSLCRYPTSLRRILNVNPRVNLISFSHTSNPMGFHILWVGYFFFYPLSRAWYFPTSWEDS